MKSNGSIRWHFPLINPRDSYPLNHYLEHIDQEMKEFDQANSQRRREEEAIDVLHAAETFVRKFFRTEEEFIKAKARVVRKNINRGYYTR